MHVESLVLSRFWCTATWFIEIGFSHLFFEFSSTRGSTRDLQSHMRTMVLVYLPTKLGGFGQGQSCWHIPAPCFANMVIIQLPGFKKSNHFRGPVGHRVTISTASSASTEVISVGSPVLEPRHDNGTAPGSLGSPLNWHWIMKDGLGMFLRNFHFKSKRMQYTSIIYIYIICIYKKCVYI